MKTSKDFAREAGPTLQALRTMVRRMAITLTTKVLWQLTGYRQSDGSTETRNAEPFTGIGVYARPPASGSPEAIVTMVGADGETPAIVAVRDEKTRANSAGDAAADETVIYNSVARMRVRSDGVIELHPIGSPPTPLDGVVTGTGIDSFTGLTYFALGNASANVLVKK